MTTIVDKLQLKVGDKAYMSDGYGRPKYGTVKRITPTGQVLIEIASAVGEPYPYRFDKYGRQLDSSSKWRLAHLISAEDYRRIVTSRKRENRQAQFVQELKAFGNWSATNAELPSKLEDFAKRLRSWQLES